jgi:polysaccharide export outer membrane protein
MAIGVRTLCLSIALSLGALASGCAGTGYDYSKEPDPRKKEYVIGVGDQLHITVWKNPELSTTIYVRPDGTITMPLMGDIRAADRTPSQLTEDISTRLKTFVKEENAVVSIAVSEVNSYRFTVSGNVEHPGVQSLKYYATISDAIAVGGGINKFGSTTNLVLLRKLPNGGVRKIPINFNRISRGDHPEENIVILAGDTLYVP